MKKLFEEILNASFVRPFKKGQNIYFRGDVCELFYIIKSGCVEQTLYDHEGNELVLRQLHPGNFFGEESIFDQRSYKFNIFAQRDTELFVFSNCLVREYLNNNPSLCLSLLSELCNEISYTIDYIEDTMTLTAYQRVSKKLFSLMNLHKTKTFNFTQKQLSRFLALSRPTTSLALQKLQEKGAISLSHSCIQIMNAEILKEQFERSL